MFFTQSQYMSNIIFTQNYALMAFTSEEFSQLNSRKDFIQLAQDKNVSLIKPLKRIAYEKELLALQAEIVNFQEWIAKKKLRLAILFEGRDASGKGGAIKRFKEHLNPRNSRVVALTEPTQVEQGQLYFRRYIKELPNPSEMVFFDRSWYNRAVVEPVMGFCKKNNMKNLLFKFPNLNTYSMKTI